MESGQPAKGDSRSPRGERGLKLDVHARVEPPAVSRSPRGERGLKFSFITIKLHSFVSLPARGAWIEITKWCVSAEEVQVAPREGGVD